ncbi:hypothetical protein PVAG01_01855 [Phlyctema vagabunda]|uniref:Uncharacterized protein n=1 Tax=Phlyctema vagabunda TaxID=108571 RepID=A0ABR4PZD6_9HELO
MRWACTTLGLWDLGNALTTDHLRRWPVTNDYLDASPTASAASARSAYRLRAHSSTRHTERSRPANKLLYSVSGLASMTEHGPCGMDIAMAWVGAAAKVRFTSQRDSSRMVRV